MRRQILPALVIVIGAYLTIVFSKDLADLMRSRGRIEEVEQEVTRLEGEQRVLVEELERVRTPEYIEKEAREKLLMTKPGETIVLLPPDDEGVVLGLEEATVSGEEDVPNWKKWARLFGFSR